MTGRHHLATDGPEWSFHQLLGQLDRLGDLGNHPGEHEVAADESGQAIADLLHVHEDRRVGAEQALQFGVDRIQRRSRGRGVVQRPVFPADTQLVVATQVVARCERDDIPKSSFADPDDLLLPPHRSVLFSVAAELLTDRELVCDHPFEVPGWDSLGPFAFCHHNRPPQDRDPAGVVVPATTLAACQPALTSCTRIMVAPIAIA